MIDDVQFHDLDAEAARFPRPALTMTPVWPTVRIGARHLSRWPTRFSGPDCLRVAGGRYALAHALRAAQVRPGTTVLFPAFHCGSMVEPALWLGANVRFYRVLENLAPEPTELLRLLNGGPRAMVLTHFFGFPQPAREIRRLCDEAGVVLVEDCAHALLGNFSGSPPGSFGHLAVASSRKFCPVSDGGIACSNVPAAPWPTPTRQSARRQVRALYRLAAGMMRHATRGPRLAVDRTSGSPRAEHVPESRELRRPASCESESDWKWFESEEAGLGMTAVARVLLRFADWDRIAQARRRNYELLLATSQRLRGAVPLHAELPAGVVPYALPLVLKEPARDFRRLKHRQVPIWRWDELAVSDCAVSASYRTSLIQLPCHENLGSRDIDWIAGVLGEVLS